MNLSPRAGGIVGLVICAAFLGFSWYWIRAEGKVSGTMLMIGVAVLPISLALTVLPTRLLIVPTEIDGRLEYNSRSPKWTTLGGTLLVLGILAGAGVYVYLLTGF